MGIDNIAELLDTHLIVICLLDLCDNLRAETADVAFVVILTIEKLLGEQLVTRLQTVDNTFCFRGISIVPYHFACYNTIVLTFLFFIRESQLIFLYTSKNHLRKLLICHIERLLTVFNLHTDNDKQAHDKVLDSLSDTRSLYSVACCAFEGCATCCFILLHICQIFKFMHTKTDLCNVKFHCKGRQILTE